MRAAVVVIGDLGRSPRTLYHAQALAARGVAVDLVGYTDAPLPRAIVENERIEVHRVRDASRARPFPASRWRYLATTAWRGAALSVALTSLLLRLKSPNVVVVQNPPGVPVLAVAWCVSRLRAAQFVVDWHNLTSSMLALRLTASHPFVAAVRWFERVMGRRADLNLFVSTMMAETLGRDWGLRGLVFRDRPLEIFQPLRTEERARVRASLAGRLRLPDNASAYAMAISPTSWTADEDMDLLFEAVDICEALIRVYVAGDQRFPHLVILLTGRGPLRGRYETRMADRQACRVHLRTIWLEAGEYPQAVAAADIGVCLHRSTSGLDLPMKIADMFGAGIPACALNYGACLSEIVQHGRNGLLFATADELAQQFFDLFKGFPDDERLLMDLRSGVAASAAERWSAGWNREVWPALMERIPTAR